MCPARSAPHCTRAARHDHVHVRLRCIPTFTGRRLRNFDLLPGDGEGRTCPSEGPRTGAKSTRLSIVPAPGGGGHSRCFPLTAKRSAPACPQAHPKARHDVVPAAFVRRDVTAIRWGFAIGHLSLNHQIPCFTNTAASVERGRCQSGCYEPGRPVRASRATTWRGARGVDDR